MSLSVDIVKRYRDFTLEVKFEAGSESMGLLGASGCGKSVTLKCIAGIEKPDAGFISINGRTVFDSKRGIHLPPQKRAAGYLFQHYALFPTLTVGENLNIVLRARGVKRQARAARIEAMLTRLRMEAFSERMPGQLSGGQQQRAAMARMLIAEPDILMLDEPLSALDSYLRHEIEEELMEMLDGFPGTVLLVSHSRDEIYRICDSVAVLDRGSVSKIGETQEVFRNPETVAAARLTGCKNIVEAYRESDDLLYVPSWGTRLRTARPVPYGTTHVGIRAHHVVPVDSPDAANSFAGHVERWIHDPFGETVRIGIDSGPGTGHILAKAGFGGSFNANAKYFAISPEYVEALRD